MLNNETNQLNHLSIRKTNRCGLGFKGQSLKYQCVFVRGGKTREVSTSTIKPVVKMSADTTSNGKIAVKTATATRTTTTAAARKNQEMKSVSQRPFIHVSSLWSYWAYQAKVVQAIEGKASD